jgi:hypothetical protein
VPLDNNLVEDAATLGAVLTLEDCPVVHDAVDVEAVEDTLTFGVRIPRTVVARRTASSLLSSPLLVDT